MKKRYPRVVVAVVAYNRARLLRECLDALENQTVPVDGVVVIDNASTDETPEVIAAHAVVSTSYRLDKNLGGAGGFAAAIAVAVNQEAADLVWIMDDDTIPTVTALAELLKAREDYPGTPVVLASRAVWKDGSTHPMNTHRVRPLLSLKQKNNAKQHGCVPVRAASFVSILVDARAIIEDGLPEADYFIWNDDLEYTARLLRHRVGLYVPSSVVEHRTRALASATDAPGERFYYEARNKVWFLTSRYPSVRDRVLWGGSMLVRWSRMFAHAENRLQMLQLGYRGIREALCRRPRPTTELLGDSVVSDDVCLIDSGSVRSTPLRILMAGSSGGHLAQLLNLKGWYSQEQVAWLTFDTPDARGALAGQKVIWATHSPSRSLRELLCSIRLAWSTMIRTRPDIVVSAGASLGAIGIICAKLLGIPTIYIEVFDRVEMRSLSGSICYRIADEFCVQWPQQKKMYPRSTVIGPLL